MKPQELRLGNIITSDGETFIVDELREDYIGAGALGVHPAGFDLDLGVPLTEEWLKRLGFEGSPETGFGLGVIELNYITTDNYVQFEFKTTAKDKWWMIDFRYVHELQNLYCALTGSSLTLKETVI